MQSLRVFTLLLVLISSNLSRGVAVAVDATQESPRKLVLIAGRPSHPPRMHEFNAGVQLLEKCLQGTPGLKTEYHLNGWPKDERTLDDADAIVFYMDGGAGHEVVQEGGRRLKKIDELAKKGVGIGCMHYGVEIVADQAGEEFKRWIGGHYESIVFLQSLLGTRLQFLS